MKILVITHNIPYPLTHGAWLCIYNIFKKLAKKHEIFLLSFKGETQHTDGLVRLREIFKDIYLIKSERKRQSLDRYLHKLLSLNSGLLKREQHPENYQRFREKLKELVRSENIDILHCTTLNMAEFGCDVKDCLKVLHIIDSSTLELERRIALQDKIGWYKKIYRLIWYNRIRTYEKQMITNFDLNITVGEKDALVLKSLSPEANIALIPNGVDVDYFQPLPKESLGYPVLLFSGNMSFPPNINAVMFFYNEIFQIISNKVPNIHLLIVGTSPVECIKKLSEDKNITITGYVDDIRTYIAKADIVICPMRMGGGIKNKILEAMASGRPVVSTSIGAEGINAIHSENIMIADTPYEFAESVLKLLNDQYLKDMIITGARNLVNEKYTWEKCAGRYEELYEHLLNNRQKNCNGDLYIDL